MGAIAQTRPLLVSSNSTGDPRIDSPEVKVIYPSSESQIESATSQRPIEPAQNLNTPTSSNSQATASQNDPKAVKQHSCKVGFTQALQQNLLAFSLLILLSLGIGYLIGKKS